MGPEVLAGAGLVSSIAGTGISAIGQANAASANQANADYQAAVAKNNQTIAEQNATYAGRAGQVAVTRGQLRQRGYLGQIRAAGGASGLDVNTGSLAAVQSSAAKLSQLDVANVAQDAALKVYGYRSQAANYGAQSGLYQQEASQAGTAGDLALTGTLLSGAGSLASKWSPWVSGNSTVLGDWSPRGSV